MNITLASLEQQFLCKLVCKETQKRKSIYTRVEITRATAVLRQQQNLFWNWYFKKAACRTGGLAGSSAPAYPPVLEAEDDQIRLFANLLEG